MRSFIDWIHEKCKTAGILWLSVCVGCAMTAPPQSEEDAGKRMAERFIRGGPSLPAEVGELLVQFKKGIAEHDKQRIRDRMKAAVKHSFSSSGLEHWSLTGEMTVSEALQVLQRSPAVRYAEANYRRYPK